MFLLIFFIIYCSMHYYFYCKLVAAFNFNRIVQSIIFWLLVALVISPLGVQFLDDSHPLLAVLVAYPCYFWMGFILLFSMLALLLDIYCGVVKIIAWIVSRKIRNLLFSSRYVFLFAALGGIAISIYGFFEGRDIHVTTINIETNKLPPQVPSLRIVQLSDAHIGLMMTKKHLQKMIDLIASTKPDLVLSTGDLIDSHPAQFNDFAHMLQQLQPRYGKYAVTGNHEFYLGLPLATKFHELAGFKLLRQETAEIAHAVTLVGVDDPAAAQLGVGGRISEVDLLYQVVHNKFTILLKHQPRVRTEAARWFDLQLSGHVHHGQIFPFDLIVRYLFKYDGGRLYNLGTSSLYVSNGAGMWGPPIRFLAPPEITVLNLSSR